MNVNPILKKTISAGFAKALAAISGFALTITVTRTLGAQESGYFMLGLAIVTILVLIFRLGLDNIVLRYVGANAISSDAQNVVNQSIKWILQYSIIGAIALFLGAQLLADYVFAKPSLGPVLKLFSFCIPFVCLFTIMGFAFQGLHKVVLATIFQNLGISFLFITTVSLLYFFNLDIYITSLTLVTIYNISAILLFFLAFYIWFKVKNVEFIFNISLCNFEEIRNKRNQLWLASIMSLFIQWSGVLFSGIYAEPSEIAYFSVAQRSAMLISFVLMVVNMVVAPRYAALWATGNIQQMKKLSNLSTRYMLLVVSPLIFLLLIYAEFVMTLFGTGFEKASILFSILVVGQFVNVATGSVGYLLNMSGHEKDVRNITLCIGLLTLIMAFLLTKFFSVLGAAIATAIGLSLQNILALLMVKKRLGFWSFI
jgi:O-antigen/teichoic acid export membrane protein